VVNSSKGKTKGKTRGQTGRTPILATDEPDVEALVGFVHQTKTEGLVGDYEPMAPLHFSQIIMVMLKFS
jgi:hypothetical protein